MTPITAYDALAFWGDCRPIPSGTTGETTALSGQRMQWRPETTARPERHLFGRPTFALRQTQPAWLPLVIAKLADLASLENGWDSYGGLALDPQSIANTQKLVQWLGMFVGVEEPAVGASPDGEAGLSWDGGPWSLDVDIRADGRIDYVYIDDRDAARDHEASTRDPLRLLALLTAGDSLIPWLEPGSDLE